MKYRYQSTYEAMADTFKTEYLLGLSAFLSLLFHVSFTAYELLWAFSIYLEAGAVLPQLFMMSRTGEAETITTHYLFALGGYRGLYLMNWVWRYATTGHTDWIAWIAGLVQTGLYADFFYIYFTKYDHPID
jgi:ER lumen protein retaining receptor